MQPFFESELTDIRRKLVLMGEKAIDIVHLAEEAIANNDLSTVQQVLGMDDELDELEIVIDGDSIRYLNLRAPVAADLRLITMAMRACHDYERIGDEACSIAKRIRRLLQQGSVLPQDARERLLRMNELVTAQLRRAMDSFINSDAELARSVPQKDREIDKLNRAIYEDMREGAVLGNGGNAGAGNAGHGGSDVALIVEIIFIAKSLERIGDHAVNIAEDVIYYLEASDIRHSGITKHGEADKG